MNLRSASWVVNGARDQHSALAIDHERPVVVANGSTIRRRRQNTEHQKHHYLELASSHCHSHGLLTENILSKTHFLGQLVFNTELLVFERQLLEAMVKF